MLSVPFKRVHPGVKDGTLETEAFDALDKLAPKTKAYKSAITPKKMNVK